MGRAATAGDFRRTKARIAASEMADRLAFTGDHRDAMTAIKREDVVHRWSQRQHAAIRAGQRFGVAVDIGHFVEIGERIATGKRVQPGLILIGHVVHDRLHRRKSAWLVWIDGRPMPIIYDHDTRAVVTVLPWESRDVSFERGHFINLANGGTRAARSIWREIRS